MTLPDCCWSPARRWRDLNFSFEGRVDAPQLPGCFEEGVVIIQGMGNKVEPDQIQALAAFNTGLNTVNELFGYGLFQLLYYLCYIITSNFLSPFFHITMFCAPSQPTFLVHSSIPSSYKDLKSIAVPIFKILLLRPDFGCKDLAVLSVACFCSYNSFLLLSQ
jgi:hypothetical protein